MKNLCPDCSTFHRSTEPCVERTLEEVLTSLDLAARDRPVAEWVLRQRQWPNG